MRSSVATLFAAFGLSAAQRLLCDGSKRPNWDDCKSVVEFFEFEGNGDSVHENGAEDEAPSCRWWLWDDGNCRIDHCFGDDDVVGKTKSGNEIFEEYDEIRSVCIPWRAGGDIVDIIIDLDLDYTSVFNDPDSLRISEENIPPADKIIKHKGGFTEGTVSRDTYLQWRDSNDKGRPKTPRHASRKRQEDDDSVLVNFGAINVRNPSEFEAGPRLSSGVEYTWEVSESTSYGTSTSAEIGGAWSVFTASLGYEITQEETYTVTEGLTYSVDCPNQGQVTLWPFYDYWEVTFLPSETDVNIWVPVEAGTGKQVGGEIAVECLG